MRETEASILICSDSSERLAAQIAQLDSIADYPLAVVGSKKIVDTYFDTDQKVLGKKRVALRIREIDGNYWIAVKGPSEDGISNVDRLENEDKWSQDSLTKIIDYLINTIRINGIQERKTNLGDSKTEPIKILLEIGFVMVQRRENFRKIRNVLSRNSSRSGGPVLAELDVDHVIYHFNSGDVPIYNIEIEEKIVEQEVREDKDIVSNSVLDTIVDELISEYGVDTFKKWNYGKIALGKGIEKLLKENLLKDMIDSNNSLRRDAFDKIEEYIQRREV